MVVAVRAPCERAPRGDVLGRASLVVLVKERLAPTDHVDNALPVRQAQSVGTVLKVQGGNEVGLGNDGRAASETDVAEGELVGDELGAALGVVDADLCSGCLYVGWDGI